MNIDESKNAFDPDMNADTVADDHVEVVVEDLFIEEYQVPLTLPAEPKPKEVKRALARLPSKTVAWVGGLIALGGIALATFLGVKRQREPMFTRLLHRVGLAR